MQFAYQDNIRVEAKPNEVATCDICTERVKSKCGKIKIWHWAHEHKENCDEWYEHETEWHREWKRKLGIDNSEITIIKDGVKHRADIKTKNNVIIELQNSPISPDTIQARENFYGEKMLWVINGLESHTFNYSERPFIGGNTTSPISNFYRDDRSGFPTFCVNMKGKQPDDELNYQLKKNGFIYDSIESVYSTVLNFKNRSAMREFFISLRRFNEIQKKISPTLIKLKEEDRKHFYWGRPKKSYGYTQRPVFLDLGSGYLFLFESGLGTQFGTGKKITKENFLKKYSSNIS